MSTTGKPGGPPGRRELRTKFAIQAIDLAQAFDSVLGVLTLGPHRYAPSLTAPEGLSTGGGKQARQHLRLVSEEEGTATILVGSANQIDRTAELRSFEHLDGLHRQRFRRAIDLDRGDYDKFLEQAKNFFAELDFNVVTAAPPADLPGPSSGRELDRRGLLIGVIVGALGMAVVAAVVVWLVLAQR